MYPFAQEPEFIVLLVWLWVMVVGATGGVVAILIAWLGRPGGMLIGGVVLGVGAAGTVVMIYQLPRFWWIGVPPLAMGIQALRMFRSPRSESDKSRWSVQLSTVALIVVAISACLAGITAIQRQRKQDAFYGQQVEAAGGYVLWSFDGTIASVLFRNQTAEALAEATPAILKLRGVTDVGLEGTPVSADWLIQLAGHLPNVDNLSLQSAELSGDIGIALAEFQRLRILDLMQTSITDRDLPPLAQLDDLERLYLNNTNVTAQGIQALRKQLPNTDISD